MITREQIIAKAREYIGTPFRHQARLKGVGVDCGGLMVCVVRDLKGSSYDFIQYPRQPGMWLLDHLRAGYYEIPVSEAVPGDAVVFWIRHPEIPAHVGILSDRGVIHSHDGILRVTEQCLDGFWEERKMAAFDLTKEV